MSSFWQRYQGMVSSFWCLSARLLLFRFRPIVKKWCLDFNQRRKLHCFVWTFERFKCNGSTSGEVTMAYILPTSAFSCIPPDA
jgi:hypothetical protein